IQPTFQLSASSFFWFIQSSPDTVSTFGLTFSRIHHSLQIHSRCSSAPSSSLSRARLPLWPPPSLWTRGSAILLAARRAVKPTATSGEVTTTAGVTLVFATAACPKHCTHRTETKHNFGQYFLSPRRGEGLLAGR
ncbi:hypothetical protein F5883DRAFT_717372, partial [Diaporthe sp. PMI_573]